MCQHFAACLSSKLERETLPPFKNSRCKSTPKPPTAPSPNLVSILGRLVLHITSRPSSSGACRTMPIPRRQRRNQPVITSAPSYPFNIKFIATTHVAYRHITSLRRHRYIVTSHTGVTSLHIHCCCVAYRARCRMPRYCVDGSVLSREITSVAYRLNNTARPLPATATCHIDNTSTMTIWWSIWWSEHVDASLV